MTFRTFALSALVLVLVPLAASAATFRANENKHITVSERIQDDLYMAGSSVSSAGTVAGDLHAGGGTIVVTGSVEEDFVAGGGNITLSGDVGGDVRAGGGSILLQGKVGGDALIGGGQITIVSGEISGDLVAGGGVIRVDAPVKGDVMVGGGDVYINAPISGAVTVYADKLQLGPSALVHGSLTYTSPQEMVMDSGARVVGQVSYTPSESREFKKERFAAAVLSLWFIARTLMLLAGALAVGLFFKRYSMEVVTTITASPWAPFGKGLVTVIALPAISAILFMTVAGIPLGILGALGVVALAIIGCVLTPVLLGSVLYSWAAKKSEHTISWKTILLGTAAYMALAMIPVLGWLVILFSMLSIVGVSVNIAWRLAKEWR